MIQLRDYQEEAIYEMINTNHQRMVVCLPTGAGKTVVFSAFTAAMVAENKTVAIAVNRRELLTQTQSSLQKMGVNAGVISAKSKNFPDAKAYVMMVETIARRKSHLEALKHRADVLIVDECHIGNFTKILDGFKRIIGFSATPMRNQSKIPLSDFYHNIYVPIQVGGLIDSQYLTSADTYAPKTSITSANFKIKKSTGDFDEKQMGDILSQEKYLDYCVAYTKKYAANKRVIVYNANIDHSLAVTNAMLKAGINAYHVDGTTPEYERKQILMNLFEQPDAVVNNVGILTFGFDCPEVETIILNRATTSLPLYLQMCGRGSRLSNKILKERFTIVDLCGNYGLHGKWEDDRDWEILFKKSAKDTEGVAPTKSCPKCDAVVHARSMECPKCKYQFPEKEIEFDVKDPELVLVETMKSNVAQMMAKINERGQNVYRGLHIIKEEIFKKNQGKSLDQMIQLYLQVLPAWCKENGKRNNQWHQDFCRNEMTKYYNAQTQNTNGNYPF
jgi:superfamily II DNA or RNA helicase